MGVAAKLRNSWWHAVASLLYETVPGMVWEISRFGMFWFFFWA